LTDLPTHLQLNLIAQCDSIATLKYELESINDALSQTETEESWDSIAAAIITLLSLCETGACEFPSELVAAVRNLARPLNSAMNSERTKLSGAAIDLVTALATGLETAFDPLLHLFFPTLLNLCTRTNKVFMTRARACVFTIIETTQLPAILTYLIPCLKDKSVTLRLAATEGIFNCMNCFNPPELEKEARARDIEAVIRTTARDANADVRKTSRKIFEAYKVLLPNRVDRYAHPIFNPHAVTSTKSQPILSPPRFIEPLSPTMKKYLDIKPKHPSQSNQAARLKAGFPSMPDLKAKAKLSASTSVLPPPPSTFITSASDHMHAHVRSASASTLLANPTTVTTMPSTSRQKPKPTNADPSRPHCNILPGKPTTHANAQEPAPARVPGSMPPPDYIPVRPIQQPPKRPTPATRVPVNSADADAAI
jgi:hypothetical protein